MQKSYYYGLAKEYEKDGVKVIPKKKYELKTSYNLERVYDYKTGKTSHELKHNEPATRINEPMKDYGTPQSAAEYAKQKGYDLNAPYKSSNQSQPEPTDDIPF